MVAWLCCSIGLLLAESGPHLTDADFFGAMDLARPELAAVQKAAERRDWPAARKAYAAVLRIRRSPEWFRVQRERPKAPARRPDTSRADKLLAHQWQWQREWFDLGPDIDWSSNQMAQGESATVEWNASLNRHFHFRELADAFRRTGEEKYAAEVVAQMLDWIADCPVLTERSGNSPYHYAWETLNTACRAGDTWPNALYAILPSDALTDDALATIVKSLVEHARHPTAGPHEAATGSPPNRRPCSSSARCCPKCARRTRGGSTPSSGSTGSSTPTSIPTAWRSSWPSDTTTGCWPTSPRCWSWRSSTVCRRSCPPTTSSAWDSDYLQRLQRLGF